MLISKREKLLFLLVFFLVIALSGTLYINRSKASQIVFETQGQNEIDVDADRDMELDDDNYEVRMIGVHIGGQVNNPGFIWIEEGKRLYDAINFVGGILPEADLDKVNLSRILSDEEKIYIPKQGEYSEMEAVQFGDSFQASSRAGSLDGSKVNINTADETVLCTLPGIGPALSKKIIEYRELRGSFKSIEDLKSVNGIGDKRYNEIKDLIILK